MPRFSQRLSWDLSPNPLTTLIQEKRKTEHLLDLTVSNPTTVLSAYPNAAIANSFQRLQDLRYYPDPYGMEAARSAVSGFYERYGHSVSSSRIALTASTSEAYALLFKLLCDPGDELLIPVPSYPLLEYLAGLESIRSLPYRFRYDGNWFIDFEQLRRQISPRTRAIVVVNPNNPTGSFLKNFEQQILVALAKEKDLAIISDEVFWTYEFNPDPGRSRTMVDIDSVLSFSLNGLSKAAGMPQMKLAWIVINGPERERRLASERLELILDTYLSVNAPVQFALPQLLRLGSDVGRDLLERASQNLAIAREFLAETSVHPLFTEGGWSLILQLPRVLSEEDWLLSLVREQNVVLQPGFFYDMENEAYAVASLITPPDIFREAMARISGFAARLTRY